jgi:hypothetical protein
MTRTCFRFGFRFLPTPEALTAPEAPPFEARATDTGREKSTSRDDRRPPRPAPDRAGLRHLPGAHGPSRHAGWRTTRAQGSKCLCAWPACATVAAPTGDQPPPTDFSATCHRPPNGQGVHNWTCCPHTAAPPGQFVRPAGPQRSYIR